MTSTSGSSRRGRFPREVLRLPLLPMRRKETPFFTDGSPVPYLVASDVVDAKVGPPRTGVVAISRRAK